MTNKIKREELLNYLKTNRQNFSAGLKEELLHFECVDRGEPEEDDIPYDSVSALMDAEQFAEDNKDHKILSEIRPILISIGYYREISQEEMDRTIVCGHGKKYNFTLNKKRYVWAGWHF